MEIHDLRSDERDSLLEALRRDLRAERARVHTDPTWADVHEFNARRTLTLLEALNPKRSRPGVRFCDPTVCRELSDFGSSPCPRLEFPSPTH